MLGANLGLFLYGEVSVMEQIIPWNYSHLNSTSLVEDISYWKFNNSLLRDIQYI